MVRGRGLVHTRNFNMSTLIISLRRVEIIKTAEIEHGLVLGLEVFRSELGGMIVAHREQNFNKSGLEIQGLVIVCGIDGRCFSKLGRSICGG